MMTLSIMHIVKIPLMFSFLVSLWIFVEKCTKLFICLWPCFICNPIFIKDWHMFHNYSLEYFKLVHGCLLHVSETDEQ